VWIWVYPPQGARNVPEEIQTSRWFNEQLEARQKSDLTTISLMKITIRLVCLTVDYTFLRGCAKNPAIGYDTKSVAVR
jgi:hypothetical protein